MIQIIVIGLNPELTGKLKGIGRPCSRRDTSAIRRVIVGIGQGFRTVAQCHRIAAMIKVIGRHRVAGGINSRKQSHSKDLVALQSKITI